MGLPEFHISGKLSVHQAALMYFGSEKQDAEGEDSGHLDDGEEQLVGFHDALRLFWSPAPPSLVSVFPFHDGHQRRGDQEHHSPEEQEVCSSRRRHTSPSDQPGYCCVVKSIRLPAASTWQGDDARVLGLYSEVFVAEVWRLQSQEEDVPQEVASRLAD